MASSASPVTLADANFANVSPNPMSIDSSNLWTRDTPVLDRSRIGTPSPAYMGKSMTYVLSNGNPRSKPRYLVLNLWGLYARTGWHWI